MARKLTPESADGVTKAHNVQHRKEQIREALAKTWVADKAIKAASDKHLAPYREDKSKIKERLRDDLNINSKSFNAIYAPYKLQQQAIEAKDEITLDMLHEMFEAAPIGGEINMVDAIESAEMPGNGAQEPTGASA